MKHRVSEFEGALLDAAVAKAEGLSWQIIQRWPTPGAATIGEPPTLCWVSGWKIVGPMPFCPSSDWSIGGPIIESEHITIAAVPAGPDAPLEWMGVMNYSVAGAERSRAFGSTPLIAAMRSYVASKFSEEVELP